MSTHALASITATYTDSEPEGEDDTEFESQEDVKKSPIENKLPPKDDKEKERETEKEKEEEEKKSEAVVPTSNISQEITSRVAKLVSYNDDVLVSDDEFDIYNHNHNSGIEGDVELPPEPTGRCSPTLLEKVQKLHDKVSSGLDMNELIQSKKEFRNPSIYEKLIQFCGINELGTNYSADVYDPSKWGKESFYEELAKAQRVDMDRREKEKKERTKVEFVSGTKKQSGTSAEEEQKKRKSKWDQVGPAPVLGAALGLIRPAGLVQASLTSSVTGTKGTSIPAFGSLPRKPRI